MPKRIGQRLGRLGNIKSITFECPHCGLDNTFRQDYLEADDICCRSCKRFFRPFIFFKDWTRCDACNRRLDRANYREGGNRTYLFCSRCAELFDSFTAKIGEARDRWLDRFRQYLGTPRGKRPGEKSIERTVKGLLPRPTGGG